MFNKVPQFALEAIHVLKDHGYQANLVGGCVRDFLLGREPGDYDINTNAMPEQVQRAFLGYHQVDTGIKHGTVSVWIQGQQVEITTYRDDGTYSDGRHPDKVTLGAELVEDLKRRDFTINAMCWSPGNGLVDMFGGAEDLEARVIRCVGNPEERFSEDALRILRALRFASVLDANIHPGTDRAIRQLAPTLNKVSKERCAVELIKLLKGKAAHRIIMGYPQVLDEIVPGIGQMEAYDQQNPYHCYTLLEHTATVVKNVPATTVDRLTAFLHDIAKPMCRTVDEKNVAHYKGHQAKGAQVAQSILEDLRLDRDTIQRVVTLIKHHDDNIDGITEAGIRRMLSRLGEDAFDHLMHLKKADNLAQNREKSNRIPNLERVCLVKELILSQEKPYKLSQLALGGDDLIALGIKPGPQMGKALGEMLELVIEERLKNTKEDLLQYAKDNFIT